MDASVLINPLQFVSQIFNSLMKIIAHVNAKKKFAYMDSSKILKVVCAAARPRTVAQGNLGATRVAAASKHRVV